jgi:chromate reductase
MITVFSCTNRQHNRTHILAESYAETLKTLYQEVMYFDFRDLPVEFAFLNPVFSGEGSAVEAVAREYLLPAEKWVFVVPEYNGSFPGVLKSFIDGLKPEWFRGKKAALVGVATGRAGNIRGMDHLTDVLMHLGVHVMHNRLPVSSFHALLDETGKLTDPNTLELIRKHQHQIINF